MISCFNKRIKDFLGISSLEQNLDSLKENQKESLAFAMLSSLFQFESVIPITSWSLSPSKILFLVNEILLNNRKKVIEFGSGFSTYAIAKLIRINNLDVIFYSVESDWCYFKMVQDMLAKEGLLEHVELRFVPLGKCSESYKFENIWYLMDRLDQLDLKELDLIIVDGPVGDTRYIRYHAVPFLKKKIAKSFCIFLDDTNRVEEQEIMEDWRVLLEAESIISKKNFSVIRSPIALDPSPYFVY